ncbi:hypothetical protein B0H34DRAFT_21418 [Crassisporium funariophilum]|nr:hypothetical protein B0H34DRAFT_21418 [Crassisporium funariophilum]
MSSFRASPWVSYEPSAASHSNRQQPHSDSEMDEDVDMEAPQISTLREEETPPPKARATWGKTPPGKVPTPSRAEFKGIRNNIFAKGEYVEAEDEEDQLIDDDDNIAEPLSSAVPSSSRTVDATQQRKASTKRKPRKGEKDAGDGERKAKEKVSQPTGAHNLAPTMSCFEATPADSHEDADTMNTSQLSLSGEPALSKAKKKVSPRKPPTVPRAKAKFTKQKTAIPPLLLDDGGALSESYAGTAASSPVNLSFFSPEPEVVGPHSPQQASAPLAEEPNLENVPIPVYPLPTKPFPVQPPPKIASGFAPLLPLDKSGRKVRPWRTANREIRGIAGGRWLAHTWVGDKESDYSSFVADSVMPKYSEDKPSTSGVAIPKLPSMSISAPASSKSLGRLKGSSKAGSAVTSATPSRAPSAIPEPQGISVTSIVRAPTKMRILQLAPSSEGDSDMAAAVDA